MKLQPRRRGFDDPGSSGSLNDLSFLLIIFFIVIAGFNTTKGFLVTLPDTSRPRLVHQEDLMRCTLQSTGAIILDGKEVSLNELSTMVGAKRNAYPNMTFLLVINAETKYQYVIDIIHEIRRLDVENFSFRMEDNVQS
jgi:biopolymer transport protein ExbD